MADKLSAKRRSWNMSRITSRDTSPEVDVRRVLSKLGYRFRLHRKDLPVKNLMLFCRRTELLFSFTGCFWHQHNRCIDCSDPKTNRNYWRPKLLANVERDLKHRRRLRRIGWTSIVIWECQTKRAEQLRDRLERKLNSKVDSLRIS